MRKPYTVSGITKKHLLLLEGKKEGVNICRRAGGGVVVRALASHHRGPVSILGPGVICPFFSGYSGFAISSKTNILNSN